MHTRILCMALIVMTQSLFASVRTVSCLDAGWRFRQGEVVNGENPQCDDNTWVTVSLPHNWGWEQAQQGKGEHRGPGWYRRTFDVGPPQTGRRYFLRFEACGSLADVYINGTHLGQHRGAFGAFCYEITQHLASSGNNILAVRASNAPESDIGPISGDFNIFGGLYRHVSVIETNEICFTLTDHASPGVTWRPTTVTDDYADLDVVAWVSNCTARTEHLTMIAAVFDAQGHRTATIEAPITVVANTTAPFASRIRISHPHLWNGRKDPYLYKAVVELRSANGELRDDVEQPLGLRSFRVDPDKGFFLNGNPYHLHGVNRHQDRPDKGWAISEADMREDLRLITEIGATVVRCAHYQHSDYFYHLCDSAGILVWAELAQVNEIGTDPRYAETARSQLLDLIRQNTNHPSIFAWSLFNELWPGRPDPHRLVEDLHLLANSEDPSRPTIAATSTEQLPQMNRIPDLLGWNIYPGWYPGWGTKDDFGSLLDRGRLMSKHGGLCISEYGAGANTEHHEPHPQQPKTDGQWHPEEWQALVHEAGWAAMKSRPFVWGTFVWVMFDFTSANRNEGAIPGRNDKGLVTYDRKTKKDAFYFYKAQWSEEPVVYITGRRFADRTDTLTDVKVYSNTGSAELLVNGLSRGSRSDDGTHIFIWKDIALISGSNRIEARGRHNNVEVADSCSWTLKGR